MGNSNSTPCEVGNSAFLLDGPDHVIVVLNAHGQGCACCCPNCLCPTCCAPEPIRHEVFAQRPYGDVRGWGHRAEVRVSVNTWALSPLGLPPQLLGRVEPHVWQQFIAQVETAFGPLLGCVGIANGVYPYEYWYDGGENEASGWRRHERYFVRIDWPPLTAPAPMVAGVPMASAPLYQPVMQAQQAPRMVPL